MSGRILMKRDSLHIGQQLTIQTAQMLMVRYMLIHHRHLTAADSRTNVTHPIIIAYTLMLVVGIGLTGLGSIEHYLTFGLFIRANQSTATTGGYHLVAIERKHTIFAKSSKNLPVKLASKAFGGILYDRNIIFICHRHDLVYLVGHPIQSHRNNRFGLSAGLVDTVPDSLLQKNRVHVPCISLRIHEYRSGTKVGHRMGRGTKSEALYYHFVTLSNSASKQGQMHSSSTGT